LKHRVEQVPRSETESRREPADGPPGRSTILDNDGLLPLTGDESLAVIGGNADRAKTGGGGSSAVTTTRTVSPVDGLRDRAPSVRFERGVPPLAAPSVFDLPGRN
jgi:beta-glucosidase